MFFVIHLLIERMVEKKFHRCVDEKERPIHSPDGTLFRLALLLWHVDLNAEILCECQDCICLLVKLKMSGDSYKMTKIKAK